MRLFTGRVGGVKVVGGVSYIIGTIRVFAWTNHQTRTAASEKLFTSTLEDEQYVTNLHLDRCHRRQPASRHSPQPANPTTRWTTAPSCTSCYTLSWVGWTAAQSWNSVVQSVTSIQQTNYQVMRTHLDFSSSIKTRRSMNPSLSTSPDRNQLSRLDNCHTLFLPDRLTSNSFQFN